MAIHYDYDKVADRYDRYRAGGGPYLQVLQALAQACSARRVLEIGAGTGNNTAAFLRAYPCMLIGLDKSWAMLSRAVHKDIPARWVQGDALHLPLKSASVDFVFGVLVLHHIPDLPGLAAECARVLKRGSAAFVTSPHDFIDRHPMNQYFPSFARIDKARFPSIEAVQTALKDAGFAETGAERAIADPIPIDRAYLEKVEHKFISTYDLIPPEEYASGLARLRADIEPHGCLNVSLRWECVTVWGRI